MKHYIYSLFAALALTFSASAVDLSPYKAGGFEVEAGYVLSTETLGDFDGSTTLGANYFLNRGVGLHLGAQGTDDGLHGAVESVEFGLIGRASLSKSFSLDFGVGSQFGLPHDNWSVYAEFGPRVRVGKVDFFVHARGIRPIESAKGEKAQLIVGTSYGF